MPGAMPGPRGLHEVLTRNTGFLLSRMGLTAQKRFQERLECLGLTARMWGALSVLEHEGPITQQALGKSMGMDPSSIVATIDELETRGLVQRRLHPSDRRARVLHVTADGSTALTRGRELVKDAQDDLLRPLSEEERRELHELLLRLAQAAAPGPGEGSTGESQPGTP